MHNNENWQQKVYRRLKRFNQGDVTVETLESLGAFFTLCDKFAPFCTIAMVSSLLEGCPERPASLARQFSVVATKIIQEMPKDTGTSVPVPIRRCPPVLPPSRASMSTVMPLRSHSVMSERPPAPSPPLPLSSYMPTQPLPLAPTPDRRSSRDLGVVIGMVDVFSDHPHRSIDDKVGNVKDTEMTEFLGTSERKRLDQEQARAMMEWIEEHKLAVNMANTRFWTKTKTGVKDPLPTLPRASEAILPDPMAPPTQTGHGHGRGRPKHAEKKESRKRRKRPE